MSRRTQAAEPDTMVFEDGRRMVRVPRPAPTPWIDLRALVVAALITSPAVYRSQQGLLSGSALLQRYALIAVGCLALSAVVRLIWPMVSGDPSVRREAPAPAAAPTEAQPVAEQSADAFAGFDDLDLEPLDGLDGFGDLSRG